MTKDQSRRSLLKLGAAVAAGAYVNPLAAETLTKPKTLEGRIFKAVKRMEGSPLDAFRSLKKLGFHGVESGNPAQAAAYAAARKETGIAIHGKVCGWHWKTRLSSPDKAVRVKCRELLENDLRAVKTLGGSSVLLVPGKVTGAQETHDDVWNRSVEVITPVLPLASRTLATSNFKAAYSVAEAPEGQMDLGGALQDLIRAHCQEEGIDWTSKGLPFLKQLQAEAMRNAEDPINEMIQRMSVRNGTYSHLDRTVKTRVSDVVFANTGGRRRWSWRAARSKV